MCRLRPPLPSSGEDGDTVQEEDTFYVFLFGGLFFGGDFGRFTTIDGVHGLVWVFCLSFFSFELSILRPVGLLACHLGWFRGQSCMWAAGLPDTRHLRLCGQLPGSIDRQPHVSGLGNQLEAYCGCFSCRSRVDFLFWLFFLCFLCIWDGIRGNLPTRATML